MVARLINPYKATRSFETRRRRKYIIKDYSQTMECSYRSEYLSFFFYEVPCRLPMSPSYQSLHSSSVHGAWVEGPDASHRHIHGHVTSSDRPRQNWYLRLVLDWWLWEIGACVISLLALAATIMVLATYSGGIVPELPKYFTVSILENQSPF